MALAVTASVGLLESMLVYYRTNDSAHPGQFIPRVHWLSAVLYMYYAVAMCTPTSNTFYWMFMFVID